MFFKNLEKINAQRQFVGMLLLGFSGVTPKPSALVESSIILLQSCSPLLFVSWHMQLYIVIY